MKTCNRCKGSGIIEGEIYSPAKCEYRMAIFGCEDCESKGWRGDETGRAYGGTSYRNERPYGEPKVKGIT
jgi:hypothetical protein